MNQFIDSQYQCYQYLYIINISVWLWIIAGKKLSATKANSNI